MKKFKKFSPLVIILTLMIFSLSFQVSCRIVEGSGNIIIEERAVSGFNSISTSGGINLVIEQTGNESLKIEADDNVIPLVRVSVNNGKLKIGLAAVNLRAVETINCYVTVKDLNSISVSNSVEVICDELRVDELTINMSNASRGEMVVYADKIKAKLTNSSHLDISGEASTQIISISNIGEYNAEGLISKECEVTARNAGFVTVHVTENLDATVSTDGQVNYIGDPEVHSKISSEGKVINITE